MYEAMFFDLEIGKIRSVYATDFEQLVNALEICHVDFEDHFVKVRFVKK